MAISKRDAITAITLATSANGTVVAGSNLSAEQFTAGGLIIECRAKITTASVVATFVVQGSVDGTNWIDLKSLENPTVVSTAAGTGTEVITNIGLMVPTNASVYPLIRCTATLSGAGTAAADKAGVNYRFVQPGGLAAVQ